MNLVELYVTRDILERSLIKDFRRLESTFPKMTCDLVLSIPLLRTWFLQEFVEEAKA